jgi:hypothetical protein
MTDRDAVSASAKDIAAAIGRRDQATLRDLLSAEFVHRTPGGSTVALEPFLSAVGEIPGEILSITVDQLTVDIAGDAAIVTGMQHARVRLDSGVVDDIRPFADWFVKDGGRWRLRVAIEPRHEP